MGLEELAKLVGIALGTTVVTIISGILLLRHANRKNKDEIVEKIDTSAQTTRSGYQQTLDTLDLGQQAMQRTFADTLHLKDEMIDELKSRAQEIKDQAADNLTKAKELITAHVTELTDIRNKYSDLEKRFNGLQTGQENQRLNYESQITKLNEAIAAGEKTITELQSTLGTKEAELAEARQTIKTIKEQFAHDISLLTQRVDTLEAKVTALETERNQLRVELEQTKAERDALITERDALKTDNAKLRDALRAVAPAILGTTGVTSQ